jgi:hypothetical protein
MHGKEQSGPTAIPTSQLCALASLYTFSLACGHDVVDTSHPSKRQKVTRNIGKFMLSKICSQLQYKKSLKMMK